MHSQVTEMAMARAKKPKEKIFLPKNAVNSVVNNRAELSLSPDAADDFNHAAIRLRPVTESSESVRLQANQIPAQVSEYVPEGSAKFANDIISSSYRSLNFRLRPCF
ncbi:hypothetical protein [Paraburkholderia tropica]|uniref:hypothetical protein n=1 Tax=Paraburkholderia tropica TaxID=92647 RepID=UPI002AB06CA6|nr:hypothetical protein [Paraburkholderia tropica]